jgi:hypothetical protein
MKTSKTPEGEYVLTLTAREITALQLLLASDVNQHITAIDNIGRGIFDAFPEVVDAERKAWVHGGQAFFDSSVLNASFDFLYQVVPE